MELNFHEMIEDIDERLSEKLSVAPRYLAPSWASRLSRDGEPGSRGFRFGGPLPPGSRGALLRELRVAGPFTCTSYALTYCIAYTGVARGAQCDASASSRRRRYTYACSRGIHLAHTSNTS